MFHYTISISWNIHGIPDGSIGNGNVQTFVQAICLWTLFHKLIWLFDNFVWFWSDFKKSLAWIRGCVHTLRLRWLGCPRGSAVNWMVRCDSWNVVPSPHLPISNNMGPSANYIPIASHPQSEILHVQIHPLRIHDTRDMPCSQRCSH